MTTDRTVPVRPAFEGTFPLFGDLRVTYTVGRDAAIEELRRIRRETGTLALDCESFGLGRDALDLKCVQIGTTTSAAVLDPRDPAQKEEIRRAIAGAEELVLHNSPFDVPTLAHNRMLTLEDVRKVTDTLIYARLAEPDERTSKSLITCCGRYFGTSTEDVLLAAFKRLGMSKQTGFRTFDLDRPIYVQGAATDAVSTALLLPVVRKAALDRLTTGHPFTTYGVTGDDALDLREREQRINRVTLRRSVRGLRVDLDYLDRYKDETEKDEIEAENAVRAEGVEPGNGNSLVRRLDALGLLPPGYPHTAGRTDRKTGTHIPGVPSAAKDNLKRLNNPLTVAFIRHKEIVHIRTDYLEKVAELTDAGGRIHPQTSILGAATGRMSMSTPPLQQFTGAARGIILADDSAEGITSVDWSQIEPVVAANVAGETGPIISGYEDGSSDMYEGLAQLTGHPRKSNKVTLLAQLYGEGIKKLAADLGCSEDKAADIRRAIFKAMPATAGLIRKLKNISEGYGVVFTLSGRIVPVPSYQGRVLAYKGVNYHVQGSAYDILAESVDEIDRRGLADAIHLLMHDEIVCASSAAHDIRKIMETPPPRLCFMAGRTPVLRTDLAVLGERWADA